MHHAGCTTNISDLHARRVLGRKEYRKAFRALEHALAINAHEPTYW